MDQPKAVNNDTVHRLHELTAQLTERIVEAADVRARLTMASEANRWPDEMALLRLWNVERIERQIVVRMARVEDDGVPAPRRQEILCGVGQITVRVYHADTFSKLKITSDEVSEKRGLSRAGSPDGQTVEPAVAVAYAKDAMVIAEIYLRERCNGVDHLLV